MNLQTHIIGCRESTLNPSACALSQNPTSRCLLDIFTTILVVISKLVSKELLTLCSLSLLSLPSVNGLPF